MKKATITLTFEGDDAQKIADLTKSVDLGTFLRDCFGEFQTARNARSWPMTYVVQRYSGQSSAFVARKYQELVKRLELASMLRAAPPTIEINALEYDMPSAGEIAASIPDSEGSPSRNFSETEVEELETALEIEDECPGCGGLPHEPCEECKG
jgi:hypothetical protein